MSSRLIVAEAQQPHSDFEAVNAEPYTAEPRLVERPVGLYSTLICITYNGWIGRVASVAGINTKTLYLRNDHKY